ncbi:MAG: response regulator [Gemmatimonadales bacterium]|nr:response regulator [Gemmatimonadales bacterium]NIN12904.1 response regulator [Gemmatimonadales bacterium]NIR00191.1 response regulator [Gemmatimonadales bacterium]
MAPPKVLFIDDDPDVLRSLGDYFEQQGHEVHRAPSGKEGIALWDRVQPEVTVLDLYMPEMNGLEVLEVLRRKRAMVIMLTAYGDIESAVEAMRLGAENFLTKPIDMLHLSQAIEKAAEKTTLRREVIELRARLTPSLQRRIVRVVLLLLLVFVSVALGRWIGGETEDPRPRDPIPVPIDSTPQPAGEVLEFEP